ncbi:replication factor subunit RPA32, putative [Babesia ovis]|uniref:Replication factor subunit RPA32, putative n=1 Tax=Babesia ovis TaxID=5869 RepID=A0A9W5TDT8_BABOV|nr:replication factor subunit RPA32, putative [Babesia ovis]
MDSFGFGVLGGIFTSGSTKDEESDTRPKTSPRSQPVPDYTPPEISGFQPASTLKSVNKPSGISESLLPIKISQVLRNVGDGSQKFALYNNPVGAICLLGEARNFEKLTSTIQFNLVDETGEIPVHYNDEYFESQQGDRVQVVGTVVLLNSENFYVEAQHVMLLNGDKYNYEEMLAHHNVSVAYAAYNMDLASKLSLQNKHDGKLTDLPGQAQNTTIIADLEKIDLGTFYENIADPLELLVLKFLKSRPESLARRSELIACLSVQYVGTFIESLPHKLFTSTESAIEAAINRLAEESEIACTKDLVCLPI